MQSERWDAAKRWWPEFVASLAAVGGAFGALLPGYHVRTWDIAASDFKTLYASAWCFARGLNPYQVSNIARVFSANGVVAPERWYGHSPIYPPFTLALLTPVTALRMVPAIYLWNLLTMVLLACAQFSLARVAGETLGLGRWWRLAIIGAAGVWPLVMFGLKIGNVSILVGACCILAVTARGKTGRWLAAVELAVAVLLKPHMAVWVVLAMLLMRERRGQAAGWRAVGLCAGVLAVLGVWTVVHPGLMAELASYRRMVQAEFASGSMNTVNRDFITPASQIVSLASLLGLWVSPGVLALLTRAVVLGGLGALLVGASRRMVEPGMAARLALVGAWCALGTIATYHRSHDGVVLLVVLPWIAARLRHCWRDGLSWGALALLAAMSVAPTPEMFAWFARTNGLETMGEIVQFRQSALAAALLACLLTAAVVKAARRGDEEGLTRCGREPGFPESIGSENKRLA